MLNYRTNFEQFFRNAPSALNVSAVRDYWQALTPFYDVNDWLLPLPPWRYHPYEDSGEKAWRTLQSDLGKSDIDKPFCIYLHTPFCSSKCGFCDSYSFKLGNHQSAYINDYVDHLCYELQLWSQQGNLSQRPVSTVHIGGGTPTFLGSEALHRIANCCQENFSISPSTEWALESTVHDLTPEVIDTMHDIGYRRLHFGVQTLEDEARLAIGRRSQSDDVLKKIDATLTRGWIVSVDMICGLPSQTLGGFIKGLETLIERGVNGFSLYELLIYPQNQQWAVKHHLTHSDRHLPNYWMYLAGAELLEQRGYHKNLFNHWADERDQNIYFTFPTRGEDLLAVGAIADGVFGNYHYRHPRYAEYVANSHSGLPGLEGGLRHLTVVDQLILLTTNILSGTVPLEKVAWIQERPAGKRLLDRWFECELIKPDPMGGFSLTVSGSWFAGNLVTEVTDIWSTSEPIRYKH